MKKRRNKKEPKSDWLLYVAIKVASKCWGCPVEIKYLPKQVDDIIRKCNTWGVKPKDSKDKNGNNFVTVCKSIMYKHCKTSKKVRVGKERFIIN